MSYSNASPEAQGHTVQPTSQRAAHMEVTEVIRETPGINFSEYIGRDAWGAHSPNLARTDPTCARTAPVPKKQAVNSVQGMNSSTSQSTVMNIITDMEVNISNGKEIYPSVQYIPYQYRLIDLTTRQQLNEFNIQVYWIDIYGGYHAFLLPSGCSCNLKLVLIRKSFYN